MIQQIIALYEKNHDYARRLIADLPDEKLAFQPGPNMNHAAWVIGHLALTADRVTCGFTLGLASKLPAEWGPLLGGKSTPTDDRQAYPSKDVLWQAYDDAHARVVVAVQQLAPADLEKATPHEGFGQRFPTIGIALLHTMIGHEQVHLGQLSAWRRVQGMPPV
ncbi:MAG: DinB family protein [Phycisphaeraceae bacterium]